MKTNSRIGRWNSDTWIALAAAVIAASGLVYAVRGGYWNRVHMKLSVRPVIFISFLYNEDGSGYELTNSGIGPAVVKWFKVDVRGKPQPNWESVARALGLPYPIIDVRFINPIPGAIYQPGMPGHIFWIPQSSASDILKKNRELVKMEICYCSLYGECWYASNVVDEKGMGLGSCDDEPSSFFGHVPIQK